MELQKTTHHTVTGGNIWKPEPDEDDLILTQAEKKYRLATHWFNLIAPIPGLIGIPILIAYIGTLH